VVLQSSTTTLQTAPTGLMPGMAAVIQPPRASRARWPRAGLRAGKPRQAKTTVVGPLWVRTARGLIPWASVGVCPSLQARPGSKGVPVVIGRAIYVLSKAGVGVSQARAAGDAADQSQARSLAHAFREIEAAATREFCRGRSVRRRLGLEPWGRG
jgi:hypothetical protein